MYIHAMQCMHALKMYLLLETTSNTGGMSMIPLNAAYIGSSLGFGIEPDTIMGIYLPSTGCSTGVQLAFVEIVSSLPERAPKTKKGPSGTAVLKTAHPLDPCTFTHKGSLYLSVSQ